MAHVTLDKYAARRAAYRKLHEHGCFVQPNPWDIGSARWMRSKGFPALATTSAGFAWTNGLSDMEVPLDLILLHIAEMVEAVPDLPLNADFENGYAADEEMLARNVQLCIATGVAGLSIEDATGDPANPLYDFEIALGRIRAARKAVDETGTGVLLTARAEACLHGCSDPLPEVCKRLAAFAEAGADVLCAWPENGKGHARGDRRCRWQARQHFAVHGPGVQSRRCRAHGRTSHLGRFCACKGCLARVHGCCGTDGCWRLQWASAEFSGF
jgi:2-methylisocitrate lyase-like PEP mutase family enzyme